MCVDAACQVNRLTSLVTVARVSARISTLTPLPFAFNAVHLIAKPDTLLTANAEWRDTCVAAAVCAHVKLEALLGNLVGTCLQNISRTTWT